MLIEKFRSNVIELLIAQARALETSPFPTLIKIDNFNAQDPVFLLKAKSVQKHYNLPKNGERVIYIFKTKKSFESEDELKKIVAKISSDIDGDRQGYTQITGINNQQLNRKLKNLNNDGGLVLYVGTSSKFSDRLRQHVGHGAKKTATIFLKTWSKSLDPKYEIECHIYNFGIDFPVEALKLIEHKLSEDLGPILGRNRKS